MRLQKLLKPAYGAAIFVVMLVLPVSCQQAYLIPDEEAEEATRNTDEEAPEDSVAVKPEFDATGWGDPIDAGFTFGGEEQEGGNG